MSYPQVGTYGPTKDVEGAEKNHVAQRKLILSFSWTVVLLQNQPHGHGTARSMDLREAPTQSFQLRFGILADIFIADR